MAQSPDIDWDALRMAATSAAARSHAPFSRLQVGAAALTRSGEVISGCNVESASFGLTLCAECGVISAARLAGAGPLVAIACADQNGRRLTPCGRCRQLLREAGGAGLLVDHDPAPATIGELLPDAFVEDDLPD